MPVGAGVIVSGNPSIYNTEVIINSITPDPAYCGDSLTIDVTVNNLDGVSTPTGDIEIVDLNTGVTVASGTLARGTATLISGSLTGIHNLVAKYLGEINEFLPSTSSPTEVFLTLKPSYISIIDPPDGYYYCNTQPLSVSVEVTEGIRMPITDGYVELNLYTNATNYLNIGLDLVDGYGIANFIIPASTTTASRINYLQAIFYGDGCFSRSQTAKGTSGLEIYPVENDGTTLVLSVDGGVTFNSLNPVTFIGTVTAANLAGPSDGYVHFYAVDITGPTTINLGDSTPSGGIASLVVPGGTFDARGTWDLYGQYFTGGDCYINSIEVSLRINPV